jgi:hypothetical protein
MASGRARGAALRGCGRGTSGARRCCQRGASPLAVAAAARASCAPGRRALTCPTPPPPHPPAPSPPRARPQAFKAYAKLRVERMNARMVGIRAKRAKEAEAAEKENA